MARKASPTAKRLPLLPAQGGVRHDRGQQRCARQLTDAYLRKRTKLNKSIAVFAVFWGTPGMRAMVPIELQLGRKVGLVCCSMRQPKCPQILWRLMSRGTGHSGHKVLPVDVADTFHFLMGNNIATPSRRATHRVLNITAAVARCIRGRTASHECVGYCIHAKTVNNLIR
ncbi:hypothetical protein LZ30DRAFT_114908 [Colletotrichum cereale]|nr:hypothetical protein LZ30DRAFT_114908 [Colletotrichum cereale]